MTEYKYKVIVNIPVVGIEHVTPSCFHSEALSNQMPNPLCPNSPNILNNNYTGLQK